MAILLFEKQRGIGQRRRSMKTKLLQPLLAVLIGLSLTCNSCGGSSSSTGSSSVTGSDPTLAQEIHWEAVSILGAGECDWEGTVCSLNLFTLKCKNDTGILFFAFNGSNGAGKWAYNNLIYEKGDGDYYTTLAENYYATVYLTGSSTITVEGSSHTKNVTEVVSLLKKDGSCKP